MAVSDKTEWDTACIRDHGKRLTGLRSHYCWDWDGMTVDETTPEFDACTCFSELQPLPRKERT